MNDFQSEQSRPTGKQIAVAIVIALIPLIGTIGAAYINSHAQDKKVQEAKPNEEIYLHPVPLQNPSPNPNSQTIKSKKKTVDHSDLATTTPVPEQQVNHGGGLTNNGENLGTQNNCTSGVVNCNFAPNLGHQDTFYAAHRPAPHVQISQTPLAAIDRSQMTEWQRSVDHEAGLEGELTANPGTILSISVDDDFTSPAFRIVCSNSCQVTFAGAESRSSNGATPGEKIRFRTATLAGDDEGKYVFFSVPNGTLEVGEVIRCRIRSLTSQPVTITSLTPFIR